MSRSPRPLLRCLAVALLLGACAPLFAQARKVDQDNLYRHWILLNTQVTMNVPNTGLGLDKPGCVAVTYTVGSDGVPFGVKVAKMVPESDQGQVAASAVQDFRYGPSLDNRIGEPVDTYYIVPFNAPKDPAARAALIAPCKLDGYGS